MSPWRLATLGLLAWMLSAEAAWGQDRFEAVPPPVADQWVAERVRGELVDEGWTVLDLVVFRTNRGILFGFGGMVENERGRFAVAGTYHQLTGRLSIDRLDAVPQR